MGDHTVVCTFGSRSKAFKDGMTFTVSKSDYEQYVAGYLFTLDNYGYVRYSSRKNGLNNKRLHRVIMNVTDPKIQIDHKNNNKLDNSRENIRTCTQQQNLCNVGLTKANTSGFKGVSFKKANQKYTATIQINYKQYYLGYFLTAEKAYKCYCYVSERIRDPAFLNLG